MSEALKQQVRTLDASQPEVVRIELPTHYPIGPVNVFLVKDDPLTLIDAGLRTDEAYHLLKEGVEAAGCKVSDIGRVLLTHGHTDHVGLLLRILDESNAKVYAHEYCAERLRNPEMGEALASTFIFRTLRECGVPESRIDTVREVRESFKDLRITAPVEGVLQNGDRIGRYAVHHVPGHSPADVLFVDTESRCAFTGDHIIVSATPVAMLRPVAEGEPRIKTLVQFMESLRRTRALDLARCYPGHGDVISDHRAAIDGIIEKQNRRTNRVRNILKEGVRTPYEVCQALFGTVKDAFLHMSIAVAVGHLEVLEDGGEASSELREGVRYFQLHDPSA